MFQKVPIVWIFSTAGNVYVIFELCILLGAAVAYPTGAPDFACQYMIPSGHGKTTATGPPPFNVNISIAAYKPGSIVTGYISSSTNVIFRGFLIQARAATTNDTTPLGRFLEPVNLTHTQCGDNHEQGLTHSNNTEKTSVMLTWKAPDEVVGDVKFKVTVVEEFTRFWLDINSDVIKDCSRNQGATGCDDITSEAPDTAPTSTSPSYTPSTQPHTVSTPSPGKIVDDKDCGVTKGCFSDCTDDGCTYLVTWQAAEDKETVKFDLNMAMSDMDDIWIGAGLSPSGYMDGSQVISCLSMSQGVVMESSMNKGYSNEVFKNATLGLSDGMGSTVDGVFHCSVTRDTNMSDPEFLSLTNKYYLLLGHGPVVSGVIKKHFGIPVKTTQKMDFLATGVSKADNSVSTLIKVHASLMIVAWMFLSSVGLVAARQCKTMLADKLFFGVKAWFLVHRPAMVTATLCVIAAIVAIFVEVGRFEKTPAGPSFTKAHPILGVIVTALTVLNPVMAIFRPSADANNRYIFNWAHFAVGTSAHISAIVTIFFGLKLEKARVNVGAFYVMVAYALVFMCVQTVLEIHNAVKKRPKKHEKYVRYASMHDEDDSSLSPKSKEHGPLSATDVTLSSSSKLGTVPTKAQSSSFPGYVLVFHSLAMLALAAFLIAIICVPIDLI